MNQISDAGYTYDAAGNMTQDGGAGLPYHTYQWNAENLLKTVDSGSTATYTYDGDGQRVEKASGILYWYGVVGEVLAETDLSGNNLREFIYFAGRRIARREPSGGAYYFFQDPLGTAKVMLNGAGLLRQESTYYPFGGEQRVINNTVDNRYKFTGLERDAETDNDHTMFRQYSSRLGRWMTPDPLAGDISNPQSLNRYAYVMNNPTNLSDPLGLDPPHGPTSKPYDPCFGDPLCQSYGPTTAGNNIFDAISGAPGTYLSYDMYGNMSFGFSPELWGQTWNLVDAERETVAGLDVDVWKASHYWLGLDPFAVPTTGYVVVQQNLGTGEYSTSGLVPDLQNLPQQLVQLGAMVPQDLQHRYNLNLGTRGPVDGVIAWSDYLQKNFGGSSWIGYANGYLNGVNALNDSIAAFLSNVYH